MENEKLVCLNEDVHCRGEVEYHSYGGRLKAFPRCAHHHQQRVMEQQRIEARYPTHAPSDFDPNYAGENW